VWEISEKLNSTENGSGGSSTIFPQLRHVIDNSKVHKYADQILDGNEVLILSSYEEKLDEHEIK
jgi:WD40 repeat protein